MLVFCVHCVIGAAPYTFGPGSAGPIHFTGLDCMGEESNLTKCPHSAIPLQCSHSEDAGVKCEGRELCCYFKDTKAVFTAMITLCIIAQ